MKDVKIKTDLFDIMKELHGDLDLHFDLDEFANTVLYKECATIINDMQREREGIEESEMKVIVPTQMLRIMRQLLFGSQVSVDTFVMSAITWFVEAVLAEREMKLEEKR